MQGQRRVILLVHNFVAANCTAVSGGARASFFWQFCGTSVIYFTFRLAKSCDWTDSGTPSNPRWAVLASSKNFISLGGIYETKLLRLAQRDFRLDTR